MRIRTAARVILLLLLGYCFPVQAQSPMLTGPIQAMERAALFPTKSMLEQGQSVAQTACSECHGAHGQAPDPQMPHLAGQRAVYLYRTLKAYQSGDRSDPSMRHASGFLNDDALLAVASYFASQSPAASRPATDPAGSAVPALDEDPFMALQPAMKKCARCHGETGNSKASGMPSLTGQDPEYFVSSMLAYTDGSRDHRMMKRLVEDLDEQTIREMGIFYAVQQPLRSEATFEAEPAAGAVLAEDCASCHGADGNASAPDMPTLAGQDPRYFVKAMKGYLEGERSHEPMFNAVEGLSETDFANLAAFYAGQEPLQREVRKPFTSAEWIERCERCHGVDGNSTDPRFPMLAGQNEAYLAKALRSYSDEDRSSSTMHAMSAPLSDNDIERIARYYSGQTARYILYIDLPCDETGDS